jgi:hypothetical protein
MALDRGRHTLLDGSILRQMPQALTYPCRGHAVVVIAVFGILFWIGSASLLGLVAAIISISWPMKYAYHVLERTAHGHFEPPAMTVELVNPLSQQPLKHLLLLLAAFALCYWSEAIVGRWLSALIFLIILLLQPAVAALIALDDDLLMALDPAALLGVLRACGRDYAIVTAVPLIMGLGLYFAADHLAAPVVFALMLYSVIATFHLTGLLLYLHRDALGFEPDLTPERDESDRLGRHRGGLNSLLDEAYRLAGAHRTREAFDMLEAGLKRQGDHLDDHLYVHAQIVCWPLPELALRHGQVLISKLLRSNRTAEALDVYRLCTGISPEFRVEEARQVLPMARVAQRLGKRDLALHVLKGFAARFPDHPDGGAVLRLEAELSARP